MLQINNLSYSITEEGMVNHILRDINLTLKKGTMTVITGPNGSGKTTLAKAIMGIVTPTQGSIVWNDQDITNLSITERSRLGICFGFQQPPRFKGLTVRDLLNIAAGQTLSTKESCHYLNQVGLCTKDYLDRDIDASLSGGEVKRIEIASVLAKGGDLMIFDEPEAGIDLWSFSRLTQTLSSIHKSCPDATIVIISHQERIIRLADELVLLVEGGVQDDGDAKEIFPKVMGDALILSCECCTEEEAADA